MSSPSSAGKRKRSASQHLPSNVTSADLLQPSSRDASGEDGDDSTGPNTPLSVKYKKQAPIDVTSAGNVPPSKRARKSSTVGEQTNGPATDEPSALSKEDPGEPSETTVASSDIESRSKGRSGLQIKTADVEDTEDMMQPPQRAGLQDPVGYHTNPPPVGRPVRVYADGVFDLFHVGYVNVSNSLKTWNGANGASCATAICVSLNRRRRPSRMCI